jgi:hypothetical protein
MKISLFASRTVRAVLFTLLACGMVFFNACAVSETSIDDVGNQFQEGLQGRGRIVPNDPTSDSFGPTYQ